MGIKFVQYLEHWASVVYGCKPFIHPIDSIEWVHELPSLSKPKKICCSIWGRVHWLWCLPVVLWMRDCKGWGKMGGGVPSKERVPPMTSAFRVVIFRGCQRNLLAEILASYWQYRTVREWALHIMKITGICDALNPPLSRRIGHCLYIGWIVLIECFEDHVVCFSSNLARTSPSLWPFKKSLNESISLRSSRNLYRFHRNRSQDRSRWWGLYQPLIASRLYTEDRDSCLKTKIRHVY